jgi:RimJ/RimL family protein N-acetyltransferase
VANVGYWVRADRTGAGYATAAVRLLAAHAFGVLGLQRLELVIAPSNAASLRVAEKVGAVREGVLRHRLRRAGAPQDAVLYSLLPGDLGPADPGWGAR